MDGRTDTIGCRRFLFWVFSAQFYAGKTRASKIDDVVGVVGDFLLVFANGVEEQFRQV